MASSSNPNTSSTSSSSQIPATNLNPSFGQYVGLTQTSPYSPNPVTPQQQFYPNMSMFPSYSPNLGHPPTPNPALFMTPPVPQPQPQPQTEYPSPTPNTAHTFGSQTSETRVEDSAPLDIWLTEEESSKVKGRKSEVFRYFILSKDNLKAKCKTCGNVYGAVSTGGTGHLARHVKKCGKPSSDPTQPKLSTHHPFGFTYNYERDRDELGKMLVHSETPFLFSENDAFNQYITTALQPQHKKISRKTVTSSAMKSYLELKEKLKFDLGTTLARVSLTADAWDSGYGLHYLCVTCHWIDNDWLLQKRIIHFKMLEWPHTGTNIAHHIFEAINEYGLRERIMSLTFDNASSMTYSASLIKHHLRDYILDDESLHVRCACHVINLCVKDGVAAIGPYYEKIRNAVLSINSSGLRLQEWKVFLRQSNLKVIKIKADCPTRWNSTYDMLSKAINYKEPITRFFNQRFPHLALSEDDWVKCEKYMGFLHLLYSMTHCFSSVYTPCSQSFLYNACLLGNLFSEHRYQEDYDVYVPSMEEKWRKYFEKIPLIYIYASILDPRQKYNGTYLLIDIYYTSMVLGDEDDKETYKKECTDRFFDLYRIYEAKFGSSSRLAPPQSSKQVGKRAKTLFAQAANMMSKFSGSESSRRTQSDVSELQMYLNYDFMKGMDDEERFGLDILEWWKGQSTKHPILAAMARDIFAIQVSSVASERAFSASGRVLDDRRTRLKPETLEMCVCFKDWLDAQNRSQDRSYETQDDDGTSASGSGSSSSQSTQLADDLDEDEEE